MRLKILLSLLLIASCAKKEVATKNSIGHLPKDPVVIIKINDFEGLSSELKNNHFIKGLEATEVYRSIANELKDLEGLQSAGESVLGFYEVGKHDLEFVLVAEKIDVDSPPGFTSEPFGYDNKTLTKLTKDQRDYFLFRVNDHTIISTSRLLIENLSRAEFPIKKPVALTRLYNAMGNENNNSLFLNFKKGESLLHSLSSVSKNIAPEDFAEWSAFDLSNEQNNLYLKGITVSNDSTKNFLNLFKGTVPNPETIASIAPSNIDGMVSFRIGDFSTFAANQKRYFDSAKEPDTLLNTIEEVGILMGSGIKTVILKSYGPGNLTQYLLSESLAIGEYQGNEMHKLERKGFLNEKLKPLVKEPNAAFWAIMDNYFIFAPDENVLKNIIANKNGGTTFDLTDDYRSAQELLPSESSIFFMTKAGGIPAVLQELLFENEFDNLKNAKLENLALTGQLSIDGQIFHSQVVVHDIRKKRQAQTVSPILNVQLENDLAIAPQFVKNHRNGNYDIVVQDVAHNLYLIDTKGKVLWKKTLPGTIRGKIHQVDLYKNGKLQMAFCTNDHFMVLDRTGEITKEINRKFEGGNLNGLAVFDYENSRDYRFVVTQANKVFMFDNNGKAVDGFSYTKAENTIINPPKHFKINKKDYLVFQLANGKLSIRHRAGAERLPVNRTIDFSSNEVFLYLNKFSVTDKKGVLHQIDTKGKLSAVDFNLDEAHGMYATSKTLALMNDNTLTIKGKKVELELGVYDPPKIFYIYDKIYVSITDLQNQKVYLFDSQAKSITNFPVYGNSVIDLTDVDNDKKLELIVKDQKNSMILYGID